LIAATKQHILLSIKQKQNPWTEMAAAGNIPVVCPATLNYKELTRNKISTNVL
jgi:hypothetical protein